MKILWIIPVTVDTMLQLTSCSGLARPLSRYGHQVVTVAAYRKRKEHIDGFSHIDYVHTPPGAILRKFWFHLRMLFSIWTTDADVVIFGYQAGHLIPLSSLSTLWRKRPLYLLDIRTVPVDVKPGFAGRQDVGRYKSALRLADRYCDGITAITPMLADTLRPVLKRLKNRRMGIWASGVELEQFDPKGLSKRSELGLNDKYVIIYHGVISPNRGLQNVVRAMPELLSKFPDMVFLVVGEGEGRAELEQVARELGVSEKVVFTGKVPFEDIPEYVRAADVGILPFPNLEGWNVSSPIKLMEYLAMGLPIVLTDIPAHRLVIDQVGGAVFSLNDEPDNLAEAICKARNEGVKPASRDVLEETISWNRQARNLIDFVESVRQTKCPADREAII